MDHRQRQIEVINKIEEQIKANSVNFSLVSPVEDYENDARLCLTGVHFPAKSLLDKVSEVIKPLKEAEPDYYYYPEDSLHLTVKSVRVINDPPHFTEEDTVRVEKVFEKVIPNHSKFNVYFYRLLLFPNNLALIGTTDPELDRIVLDLDAELKKEGIPDDKQYTNSKYFFSNMTLARFSGASEKFKQKVNELSSSISFQPYSVDSVVLVTCNAVFKKRRIINTWSLK